MNRILPTLLFVAAGACLTNCSTISSKATIDSRTQEVLSSMSAKLRSAETLRFDATRSTPSGFHAVVDLGESTRMSGALRRPNKIVVNFTSDEGTRMMGYDGKEMVLVDHKSNTYMRSPAPPTGEGVLRALNATFNFVPPAAEVLTVNPESYLLEGATVVEHRGQKLVDGVLCDHIFFQLKNSTRDLWISTTDRLPKRVTITYPNDDAPPIPITTTIHRWQLNAPVTDADLAFNIPATSKELQGLKLRQ